MANKHYRSWLYQMPIGFIFTTASIFILMYAVQKTAFEQWIMMGLASAVSLAIGLIFFGNAIIHKVKSDLIRKDKKRHTASTIVEEEHA